MTKPLSLWVQNDDVLKGLPPFQTPGDVSGDVTKLRSLEARNSAAKLPIKNGGISLIYSRNIKVEMFVKWSVACLAQ